MSILPLLFAMAITSAKWRRAFDICSITRPIAMNFLCPTDWAAKKMIGSNKLERRRTDELGAVECDHSIPMQLMMVFLVI